MAPRSSGAPRRGRGRPRKDEARSPRALRSTARRSATDPDPRQSRNQTTRPRPAQQARPNIHAERNDVGEYQEAEDSGGLDEDGDAESSKSTDQQPDEESVAHAPRDFLTSIGARDIWASIEAEECPLEDIPKARPRNSLSRDLKNRLKHLLRCATAIQSEQDVPAHTIDGLVRDFDKAYGALNHESIKRCGAVLVDDFYGILLWQFRLVLEGLFGYCSSLHESTDSYYQILGISQRVTDKLQALMRIFSSSRVKPVKPETLSRLQNLRKLRKHFEELSQSQKKVLEEESSRRWRASAEQQFANYKSQMDDAATAELSRLSQRIDGYTETENNHQEHSGSVSPPHDMSLREARSARVPQMHEWSPEMDDELLQGLSINGQRSCRSTSALKQQTELTLRQCLNGTLAVWAFRTSRTLLSSTYRKEQCSCGRLWWLGTRTRTSRCRNGSSA